MHGFLGLVVYLEWPWSLKHFDNTFGIFFVMSGYSRVAFDAQLLQQVLLVKSIKRHSYCKRVGSSIFCYQIFLLTTIGHKMFKRPPQRDIPMGGLHATNILKSV